MHVAGVSADPATFEHVDPDVVGNRRELLISELSGKGTVQARARDAGVELDYASRRPGSSSASRRSSTAATTSRPPTGRSSYFCAERAGDYEPLFRLEHWRAIVEKRADGAGGNRGHDQDLGPAHPRRERYVRTAEGNGP